LLTAAPFVAEGVLAVTCAYGQIYACAVLALEVSDQAGLKIPTEVGDAIYVANKAPQCIDGDVVACAYLGARGAKAAGLEGYLYPETYHFAKGATTGEMLLRMIGEDKNITVLRGTIPLQLDGDGVAADQRGAEQRIPMDSLVFAGRLFSRNELSRSFADDPKVMSIGDCREPGTIMDAVWGGFNTVREIEN